MKREFKYIFILIIFLFFFSCFCFQDLYFFSSDNHYRFQTESLLDGRFKLSAYPSGLEHDYTWSHRGGVHQVWGLGVPLLRLPFEAIARLLEFDAFPDRLVLGGYFFCTVLWGFRVLMHREGADACNVPNDSSRGTIPLGDVQEITGLFLLFFFPSSITLLSSRMAVYEEALVYTYLYGIAEALTLLWFIRKPQLKGWLILSAMAGLGAFIRPTLLFYGAASMLVGALLLFLNRPHPARDAAPKSFLIRWGLPGYSWLWGPFLFLLGGGLLFLANLQRFDDGFEFGHKLNLQVGESMLGSMYSTRFDCPWQDEPLASAAKELFGMLFLPAKFNNGNWYEENLFPGQSSTFRWRDTYLRTYDLSVLGLVLCGFTAGAVVWPRRKPNPPEESIDEPAPSSPADEMGYLALWSFLAAAPLVGFYLWAPVISSRYMFDFAPAFAFIIFAFYNLLSKLYKNKLAKIVLSLLFICWIIIENFFSINNYLKNDFLTKGQSYKSVKYTLNIYSGLNFFHSEFDCMGWDKKTGKAGVLSVIFVHDAEYLELELEPNQSLIDEMAKKGETRYPKPAPEVIRAKIGLEYLERESNTKTDNGWKIRFKGPQRKVYQSGYQVVFLAMIAKEDLGCRYTPWLLKSVRWNETDPPKTITPKEPKETSPPHEPQPSAETKV